MYSTTEHVSSPDATSIPHDAPFARLIISQWASTKIRNRAVIVDGQTLSLAKATLVGEHKGLAYLTEDVVVRKRIDRSLEALKAELGQGGTVYGVNTGYGGSADVRCDPHEMPKLQEAVLQVLNCGLLPLPLPTSNVENAHSSFLKPEWVRAAMLIRANSVARGHSAVRISTIQALLELLNHDVIPLIPTRGSISASGDLSPLSYIAGALEGNPGIYCWIGPAESRRLLPAPEALSFAQILPVTFEPKEALGLVNGTAISAAAASLTLCSMHNLLALSQLLTAMNVEAMLGAATSFAPFISEVRPHPGQKQVASTILAALEGSKLAISLLESHSRSLFQDRYSLRTVPQWLGPFVEDLLLANEQLTIELNSTTDNPIIDPDTGNIYHGGNFQAVSVTSAMEKCRLAAQAIGRMLFAQFTESANPATNLGLPPNLCADEPSTSFTMKGVDISMAAYMSELSFLANPVHNHVVCAEMGNQALNSLALISARYSDSAVDVLRIMCACTLYGACQALDLRAMQRTFEGRLEASLNESTTKLVHALQGDSIRYGKVTENVWQYVKDQLPKTTTLDGPDRFKRVMIGAKAPLVDALGESTELSGSAWLSHVKRWTELSTANAIRICEETRREYLESGDASELLGRAAKRLYLFVRKDLNVPMHRGIVDHPTCKRSVSSGAIPIRNDARTSGNEWREQTIGHWISIIHEAIKSDKITDIIVECLEEGLDANQKPAAGASAKNGGMNGSG